jgi:thymidylate synthase ThyX
MQSFTSAKLIAYTQNPNNPDAKIATFEYKSPRFILAEINTHRLLTRSAASSRAIPISKRIDMAFAEPFVPLAFGKNKPGMMATDKLTEEDNAKAINIWLNARDNAALSTKQLAEIGAHKEHANRLLEPFVYFIGVITATELDNWFNLRDHPEAQPEIAELARCMKVEIDKNQPKISGLHLPYTDDLNKSHFSMAQLFSISSARCARSSYKTQDGQTSTYEKDLELCERLIGTNGSPAHLSPFDHSAIADTVVTRYDELSRPKKFWSMPREHRQYFGWIPHRVNVERNLGLTCARNSYDSF